MSQALLLLIVVVTAIALTIAFPRTHAIHLGFIGLLAYSVPALLATSLFVGGPGVRYFYEASGAAIDAMCLVWLGFGVGALTWKALVPDIYTPIRTASDEFGLAPAAAVAAFFLYLFIANYAGPLFFLRDRHDLIDLLGGEYTILGWVVVLGMVTAVAERAWLWTAAFSVPLACIVYAGDRTLLVVAVAACALAIIQNEALNKVIRRRSLWLAMSMLVASVFIVKPTYTALKSGLNPIVFISEQKAETILSQWEAFIIHEILERVISRDFSYSPFDAARNLLGQFLVVPSAFGIDSSQFNTEMQPILFPLANFGLAHNMWAQWFAMFGILGCLVGGALYAIVLSSLDRTSRQAKFGFRYLLLLGAALTAVYAHRNSVENLAAHLRIVSVSFACVWLVRSGMSGIAYFFARQISKRRLDKYGS